MNLKPCSSCKQNLTIRNVKYRGIQLGGKEPLELFNCLKCHSTNALKRSVLAAATLFLLTGCPEQSTTPTEKSKDTVSDSTPVVSPNTGSPPNGSTPHACAGHQLLGTWQNNNNPSERWTFNDDCTGENEMCDHQFTFPASYVGTNFLINNITNQLNIPECNKPAGGPVEQSRTCAALFHHTFPANQMQFACNYHGANMFTKVP